MSWKDKLYLIPSHMHDGVTRYIEDGIEPGDFMKSIFANDFVSAWGRADYLNQESFGGWAEFLSYCPPQCFGNQPKITGWMSAKGLNGISAIMNTQKPKENS